jgi:hypothetical protein
MLIVLDPGPVEAAVMSEAAVGAALDPGSTGLLPEVEFPDTDFANTVEGADGLPHYAGDQDIDEEGDAGEDSEGRVSLGDEAPDESGAMIGGALHDQSRDEKADDDGGFDFDRDRDGAPRTAVALRRAPRSSGGFGEMIKALLGAILGVAIGYYILLWLGKDPMQIKPFLESYLPDWLVP